MSIQTVSALAASLSLIVVSDAWASCRRVAVPEIVGVAVFKHYRVDGGEVVEVVINNDVVRHYRTLGGKAKVRKLEAGKVRQVGWMPRNVLSRPVPCVAYRRAATQTPEPPQLLLDLFKPFELLIPAPPTE